MIEETEAKIYRLSDEERDAIREGLESPVARTKAAPDFRTWG
jgi:hypothetical protein